MTAVNDPHEESIKVCCRFRPENQLERDHGGRVCVEVPDDGATVHVPGSDQTFVYDRVFGWEASQKEVYDYAAKPIINAVLRGFNGTVFAYGQTSSGKTYTMEGPDFEDKVYQGVIPRMVWSIFDGIYHADEHVEFLVKVSIVEIYNERIRDLLDPKKDNLKVHEDKARGVFIGEVTESYVGCEQEIFDAMKVGHYNRTFAVTNMNEHSSRSHLVFMLTVEQKNLHDRSVKVGKLHLVDLAGSEKVAKTGASGERLDEAKNINRSLSALGHVINTLTDKKYTHVPYRDSKLTRVLQESLGGNAKTSLIITCSPSNFNEQETVSTLRFGQRAKMIKNVVKVNHERSAEELKLLLEKKDLAIRELQGRCWKLEQLLTSHGLAVPEQQGNAAAAAERLQRPDEAVAELMDQLQDSREQLRAQTEQITEFNRERDELVLMNRQLMSQMSDAKDLREQIEYERNEQAGEVERLRQEVQRLQLEVEDLHRSGLVHITAAREAAGNGSTGAPGAGGRSSGSTPPTRLPNTPNSPRSSPSAASAAAHGYGGDPTREAARGLGSQVAAAVHASGGGTGEARASDMQDRLREEERPLKRKVSQLDKNLEQLTVMYHKLVAQNSGLKVEVSEEKKKCHRKDQRIIQLERNLREAKQKYEKLLTQCANLTSSMDSMGRAKTTDPSSTSQQLPHKNIVRVVRGGLRSSRSETEGCITYAVTDGSPPSDSPASATSTQRRNSSRSNLLAARSQTYTGA